MDCYLNKLHIPPGRDVIIMLHDHILTICSTDMMASLEDVMVLIVIVAMEYVVYPHLSKTMRYNFPPLHKVKPYEVQ